VSEVSWETIVTVSIRDTIKRFFGEITRRPPKDETQSAKVRRLNDALYALAAERRVLLLWSKYIGEEKRLGSYLSGAPAIFISDSLRGLPAVATLLHEFVHYYDETLPRRRPGLLPEMCVDAIAGWILDDLGFDTTENDRYVSLTSGGLFDGWRSCLDDPIHREYCRRIKEELLHDIREHIRGA